MDFAVVASGVSLFLLWLRLFEAERRLSRMDAQLYAVRNELKEEVGEVKEWGEDFSERIRGVVDALGDF